MDWLASIGGIERILLKFIALFFGGYIKFTCDIEVMKMLYGAQEAESSHHEKDDAERENDHH